MAQNGTDLPPLETIAGSNSAGNFGLIIIIGLASYDYGGSIGWESLITSAQWTALYSYQLKYGVRMVHLDGYPGNFVGTALAPGPGGCCSTDEQEVYLLEGSLSPNVGQIANYSTLGLWHYPAIITDFSTTIAFLAFGTNPEYSSPTVAGVIQDFGGREQMVFFLAGGSWSSTTNYLGAVWFNWGYGDTSVSSPTTTSMAPTTTSASISISSASDPPASDPPAPDPPAPASSSKSTGVGKACRAKNRIKK